LLTSRPLYKLCFLAGVASLVGAAGCGGGGVIIPHPTGNFSNASFNGSFVYAVHGFLADGSNSPYRETGVITADGAGHITAGTDAFSSSAFTGVPTQSTSVTGTYTIASDGTGQIVLSSTGLGAAAGSPPVQISLAVTLASASKADLMEADAFASGGGTAELQDPTAISAAPSGTFVFRLHHEVDAPTLSRSSKVGFFSFSGGNLSAGSMDQNVLSIGISSLSLTSGTLGTPTTLGAGTGSFTDSSAATTDFLYYIVNNGKFVLLASNSGAVGSGSAEVQTGAVSNGLAGNYAFGSRGDDTFYAGVETVGRLTGTGATISSGTLDSMQDGTQDASSPQPVAFTGIPTTTTSNPSPQGRVQVTLSTGTPVIFWMVSPSRAFFLNNTPNTAAEDGTADLQTITTFSAATFKGQFALLMDGIDTSPEGLARVGTLQFDGAGRLTLVEVVNASLSGNGATIPGALAGTYQIGGGGRLTASVSNGGGGLDLVMYAVSGSQAYVLQVDQQTNTSGTVQLQQ
jgi:hypothetical protein